MDLEAQAREDKDDMQRILQGGADLEVAITNIYMRYAKDIQMHYRRKGLDWETAEDLAQDVFIKLLEHRESLKDVRMLGPWMWRIVFTNKADYFRHKETKVKLASVDDEILMNHHATDNAQGEDVKQCIEECFKKIAEQDEQRAYALRLSLRYEWDIEQLASFLDKKTKHATCEYISQSRKKIKPCLEDCRELLND